MADDQQQTQQDTQPAGNQPKSIDGVRQAPKLSGENQEHHLQEVADQPSAQQPAPQPQPQQQPVPQPTNDVKQPQQPPADTQQNHPKLKESKKPTQTKPEHNNFPYAAVILAVVIGSALIGLAVFLQVSGQ